MKAELAEYFEQELRFLRDALLRYAAENPEAAAKLQINAAGEGYPDVERIVQGAAFLNARTARRIDDGHADIIAGFLNVLYPHYLRPLPSLAIVEFEIGPTLAAQPVCELKREECEILTNASDGDICTFRPSTDVVVLPVKVDQVKLMGPPFAVVSEKIPQRKQNSLLRFRVSRQCPDLPIRAVKFGEGLRLFIREKRSDTFEFYEFLLRHVQGIAFSLPNQRVPFVELPPSSLRPVGLEVGRDRLLPYSARSFSGYGLLTELFAYPSRFSFVELDIPDLTPCGEGSVFDVSIFLDEQSSRLEASVEDGWLRPNCQPVLNLFNPANPVQADFDLGTHEVPLVLDPQRNDTPEGFQLLEDRDEIFSVDDVELYNTNTQERRRLFPLYAVEQGSPSVNQEHSFWVRREYVTGTGGHQIVGSDVYLQTVTPVGITPEEAKHLQYRVRVTAMNRDVPLEGKITMWLAKTVGGLEVKCLQPPCPAIRPYQPSRSLWRLVNHMAMNHAALLTTESLRDLLRLYDIYETVGGMSAQRLIRSIVSFEHQPSLERVYIRNRPAFVRGTQIKLGIEGKELPAGKAFLLGSVLSAFLTGFHSLNGCASVTVMCDGEEMGTWKKEGRKSDV